MNVDLNHSQIICIPTLNVHIYIHTCIVFKINSQAVEIVTSIHLYWKDSLVFSFTHFFKLYGCVCSTLRLIPNWITAAPVWYTVLCIIHVETFRSTCVDRLPLQLNGGSLNHNFHKCCVAFQWGGGCHIVTWHKQAKTKYLSGFLYQGFAESMQHHLNCAKWKPFWKVKVSTGKAMVMWQNAPLI